jgi:hypothetical protein
MASRGGESTSFQIKRRVPLRGARRKAIYAGDSPGSGGLAPTWIMKIPFWTKAKREAQPSNTLLGGSFPAHSLTLDHALLLREIGSPWSAPFERGNSDAERAAILRDATRTITVAQLAEFAFVVSRPASAAKLELARGRNAFTAAALAWVQTIISLSDLERLVPNSASVVADTVPKPQGGYSST